jgi:hypothetical protein
MNAAASGLMVPRAVDAHDATDEGVLVHPELLETATGWAVLEIDPAPVVYVVPDEDGVADADTGALTLADITAFSLVYA